MERTYLNGWTTFMERTTQVPEQFSAILDSNRQVTHGDIYSAMRGLNTCRFEATELRDRLSERWEKQSSKEASPQALVDGAMGLAGCAYKPANANKMITAICKKL